MELIPYDCDACGCRVCACPATLDCLTSIKRLPNGDEVRYLVGYGWEIARPSDRVFRGFPADYSERARVVMFAESIASLDDDAWTRAIDAEWKRAH